MLIRQALPLRRRPVDTEVARWLEEQVRWLSVPRHGVAESSANRRIADDIALAFQSYGYRTTHQGRFRNVLALPEGPGPFTLVCAHYDTVPGTPGADDNASAVAVMLGLARQRPAQTAFVAFNREEDGMLGSTDFVEWLAEPGGPSFSAIHVLEMVGYTDPRPGSQRVPYPIPRMLVPRDTGDFIAIVGIGAGWSLAGDVRRAAKGSMGVPPVLTLQAPLGLLGWAPDLGRSDHFPFIQARLPAVMWTDTAEFRTPHYHRPTDTPQTLDVTFMAEVLELLRQTVDPTS
ncbi:MAG: M28 family peptidase [Myxococcota bacterium]